MRWRDGFARREPRSWPLRGLLRNGSVAGDDAGDERGPPAAGDGGADLDGLGGAPAAADIEPGATVADYLIAVPNGGLRNPIEAALLRAEGAKAGVSDLLLPIARQGAHGLWIEMKRPGGGGRETDAQRAWRSRMERAGYRAIVCHGWDEAREALLRYVAEATIQRLIELGRGNLSAGIRSAASAVSAVSAIETARIVPCIDNL